MATLHRKKKHPMLILKGYRLYLMGSDDSEITKSGVCVTEIQKFKRFHEEMIAGKVYYRSAQAIGIEKHIAKKMFALLQQNRAGLQLSYGMGRDRETHPKINTAFSLLVDGLSESEMRGKGCSELEIRLSKEFLPFAEASETMLLQTIAEKTGMVKATVARLLKIYREKQQAPNNAKEIRDYRMQINA